MKTELISTVFLSEKRKNTLLMLMEQPATIDDIKESLTGTTSAIMAQMKILLEQGLIEQTSDEYRLTYIGKIILRKIKPLMEALSVLEENKEYWESRDMSAIPDPLLDRIGDLGQIMVYQPDLNHLFEPPKQLCLSLKQSTKVSTFYSYFCPSCPMNYSELAKKEINFDLILTRSVYNRLKEEYTEQYDAMINSSSSNIFICEDSSIRLGALSITDDLLLIAFFNKQGIFDHKKVISFEESARQWGMDLFGKYRQMAEKVK
ncbi:helix-turn-helix transcriptional regulator [Methanolobus chelungpuianus]|uniref:ArsR family transcriptional regulator n=1 Tax=Methanolobus chelungpuianus TaxID=502115 RepID=A0AAE3HCB2_9EURY|nr:winged helix-turn-helix domain-containing protein [Methanolobus chelungpuianus]MCQ6963494.1 ArsR family transcriptional regulator [Methanolobus chelungpuianus]